MKNFFRIFACLALAMMAASCFEHTEWVPPTPPDKVDPKPEPKPDTDTIPDYSVFELNVVGRYLKDNDGNIVNLHGFGQTECHIAPILSEFVRNLQRVQGVDGEGAVLHVDNPYF